MTAAAEDATASSLQYGCDHDIGDAVRAEVVEDFEPWGEREEHMLSLRVGEVVWVLEKHETGWWGGHKEGDETMGWFPDRMVKQMGPPMSPDPTRTRDLRVVASPQANGARRLQLGAEQRLHEETRELRETAERLETELASERRRRQAEERVRQVEEAKCAHLSREKEVLISQREQEKDMQNKALLVERQQWERRMSDMEQKYMEEVRRLQAELKRKEAELEHRRCNTARVPAAEQHQGGGSASFSAEQSAHSRAASADISRRLFSHQMGTGSGGSPEASGTWSPPVAVATAPVVSAVHAVAAAVGPAQPLSSRQGAAGHGLSRPSPRTVASAPGVPWTAVAQATCPGPPAASHHHLYRAPCEAGARSHVTDFERRSNSQGAPPRTADASPSRQVYVVAGPLAARARPALPGTAQSRSGSREHPPAAGVGGGGPLMRGSPEDSPPAFDFGMSPMPRQPSPPGVPCRGRTVVSSPSARPAVSVQDRIRQFNPQQTAPRCILR